MVGVGEWPQRLSVKSRDAVMTRAGPSVGLSVIRGYFRGNNDRVVMLSPQEQSKGTNNRKDFSVCECARL